MLTRAKSACGGPTRFAVLRPGPSRPPGAACELAHELTAGGVTVDYFCAEDAFHDEDAVRKQLERLIFEAVPVVPGSFTAHSESSRRPRPLVRAGEIGAADVQVRRLRANVVRVEVTTLGLPVSGAESGPCFEGGPLEARP